MDARWVTRVLDLLLVVGSNTCFMKLEPRDWLAGASCMAPRVFLTNVYEYPTLSSLMTTYEVRLEGIKSLGAGTPEWSLYSSLDSGAWLSAEIDMFPSTRRCVRSRLSLVLPAEIFSSKTVRTGYSVGLWDDCVSFCSCTDILFVDWVSWTPLAFSVGTWLLTLLTVDLLRAPLRAPTPLGNVICSVARSRLAWIFSASLFPATKLFLDYSAGSFVDDRSFLLVDYCTLLVLWLGETSSCDRPTNSLVIYLSRSTELYFDLRIEFRVPLSL
jgi:hypothetical protein